MNIKNVFQKIKEYYSIPRLIIILISFVICLPFILLYASIMEFIKYFFKNKT